MKKNAFKIIELLLDELNLIHGVDAVSLVHDPAIEADFYHFNKEYFTEFATIDNEKRMVVGPALIPNKMILRKQDEEYYYVYFSPETIRATAKRFLIKGNQNNSTLEHNIDLNGISVVESWIIESKEFDKSKMYGYDLPIGTWMLTSYIDNDDVWAKIKSGEVKGYSIEGRYTDKLLEQNKVQNAGITDEEFDELIGLDGTPEEKKLYRDIMELLDNFDKNEQV